MKYLLFFIIAFNILFSSCKKDDTACYVYTITSVSNIIPPPDSTYPKTEIHEEEECGIDEATAKQYNEENFYSSYNTLQGYIFTVNVTSVYRKK
jgi:hypothetical protein